MKTIFITSFHGLVSRVLEGGVLERLLSNKCIRVVLFVPDFKETYFKETFQHERVIVEGVGRDVLPKRAYLFNKFSFVLLNTKTMRITRRSLRGYNHFYKFLIAQFISSGLGRWRFVRELFRFANYTFSGPEIFKKYLDLYKPDLVFSTDVKEMLDAALLIEAKKRGIKTVGMARSWDYLTGKGVVQVKPDELIVHNEIIKEEAIDFADMDRKSVHVIGMPHFDLYKNEKRSPRDEVLKKLGVKKRYLLYVPWGDKFVGNDWQFLQILAQAVQNGQLPSDLSIVLRLPPGDTVSLEKLPKDLANMIIVDAPGVVFEGKHRKANEMSYGDLQHLADVITHSELLIAPPSTMVIDAAALNKPVVIIKFNGTQEQSYYRGVMHCYDFIHISKLMGVGGFAVAENGEELIDNIHMYLKDSHIHDRGRSEVVRSQCYRFDGKAGERLVNFLIKEVQ